MSRILLARAATFAKSAGSRISKTFKNPNTQDSLVISSSELGAAVGKKVLDGGRKKTPPSPSPSPSPNLILNPDAMVEEVGHHSQPCCFPILSSTRPTPLHRSSYSDFQPMLPEEVFRGEGGDLLSWKRNGGASMIVLHHRGLAQPFFSDHSKFAIVLEGSGTAGLVLANDNLAERVVEISSGDVIPVPSGAVTWWFNSTNTKLAIVFLGQHHLTDFYLAGPRGVLGGFSSEVLSTFLELDEAAMATVLSSQTTQGGIVRVGPEVNMPLPNLLDRHGLVFNPFSAALLGAGDALFLNSSNLLLFKELGCGASIIRLGSGSTFPPAYACATKFQMIFVFSGSGHVEVVGPNADSIIDAAVETGHLFLVPNTCVLSATAGDNGLRWLSIVDTPTPRFITLVGENSLLKRLSAAVVQGAFNVDPDMERRIRFPSPPPH